MSSNSLMTGIYRYMLSIPPFLWKRLIAGGREGKIKIGFMTDEHQLVHHFVVSELPRIAEPMSPEFVSESLSIPLERVETIFDDLEKNMTFICRDNEGKALWAYPVTAEKTPHQLTFSTGEQIYAA